MSFGINFRATSGYVTDNAGETYSLGEAYPTTRGGITFGWDVDSTAHSRDRNSGNDRRLAGIVFENATTRELRVDLPAAGTYPVKVAFGDAGFDQAQQKWSIKDGASTTLDTVDDAGGTVANHFDDVLGTDYTNATWPGSAASKNYTFATTQLRVALLSNSGTNPAITIAHLFVGDAIGGAKGPPFLPGMYRPRFTKPRPRYI